MIRDPQIKDIPQMTALTKEIYGEFMTKHGMELNSANLKTTVEAFVKTKSCIVCEREGKIVGIAAWFLSPHPGNFSVKVFQEILWCVNSPNLMDASRLFKALENKAHELGANVIIMINLSSDNQKQLNTIYTKLGYDYLESYHIKKIGG